MHRKAISVLGVAGLILAMSVGITTSAGAATGTDGTTYTNRQLNSALDRLDAATRPSPRAVTGWYVSPRDNRVVIVVREKQEKAAYAFAERAGVDTSAVKLEATKESPRLFYDVRGGDAYYTGQYRCSIGFSVNGGYTTAGHCGSTGGSTSGYNQQAQGSFAGSIFPGNDMAWVRVNSNWTPQPWVNRYSAGSNLMVQGHTEAAVGAQVCRSGSTTGWHCGTIQAKNQTVNYPEGTVQGLTRTNVCAEGGDSGGSFITPSGQAQGMTSGGSGNCTSGGTTYFQPLNPVLSRYSLTLVTDGGGDPDPPGGCEGLPETFNGNLSGTGSVGIHPNGTYWQAGAGTFRGCLNGPDGVDFDLYLRKWNGSAWVNVAAGETSAPDESVSYNGTSGYYYWRVVSYRGSGAYSFSMNRP